MTNDNDLLARVIQLETKLAFHEETIDTLNTVVTRVQATVDRLTHEVDALRMQLRRVAPSLIVGSSDEKPPHY